MVILLQVGASMYLLQLILIHYLTIFIGIGKHLLVKLCFYQCYVLYFILMDWKYIAALVFVFTAFFVYEQYEYEIDGLVKLVGRKLKVVMELLVRNLPPSVASRRAVVKHRK